MSNWGHRVLDPFLGVGTSIIAAMRHDRKGIGAEIMHKYVNVAKDRIMKEQSGELQTRPMNRPVYDPSDAGLSLSKSPWTSRSQLELPVESETKGRNED
jgi:adenine-specific DNA-methyltransferase